MTPFKLVREKLKIVFFFITAFMFSQVNTGGKATTADHQKQVIGYISNWDAWKDTKAGVPKAGALTHLNIDYSKYTILNYSFFGVARDGSLHSGDHRNKKIYQASVSQEPADLFYTDLYSSWDLHLLFGELEYVNYVNPSIKTRAEAQGFQVEVGASTWTHPVWGLSGGLPLPLKKENGALGLLDMAHKNGVKVMASIGGWSMCKHFPEMAADPVKKARFIEDCKKLIAIGFDGIDLDWEYPGPYSGMNFTGSQADFANFETLVQDIRNAIGVDKLITSAMAADPRKLEGFNWTKLSKNMDYYNIMTYDYNGGWSNKAGHNAPVYPYSGAEVDFFNWQSTLNKLVEVGVPKKQICFGAPFYGRGVITDGPAALNKKTVKRAETLQPDGPIQTAADYTNWPKEVYDGTPNYFFIKQKALSPNSGWTRKWDNEAKVPYLVKDNFFLSYDDEESIGIKAKFINDNGLGGTIVWTVFGDLEISGSVTSFGRKLKRWSNVKSPLVNKINEVFAEITTPPNNEAPTVSVLAPVNNSTLTAGTAVKILARAADSDGTVTKVEFYDGTVLLGQDTSSPYEYNWATPSLGAHTITAKAFDNDNASTVSLGVNVTVEANTASPVVTITSPVNNYSSEVGSNVALAATVTNAIGNITSVVFDVNGVVVSATNTGDNYTANYTASTVGEYVFKVKATNSENKSSESQVAFSITKASTDLCVNYPVWSSTKVYTNGDDVQYNNVHYRAKWWTKNESPGKSGVWERIKKCGGDTGGGDKNVAPTVSISAPTNNSVITEGDVLSIDVNAADSDGTVTLVEFYRGTVKLGEDTTSPYTYSVNNLKVGTYELSVVATDNDMAKTTSSSVTVTVESAGNTGGCNGVAQYVVGTSYSQNAEVQNNGEKFSCSVAGWCSSNAAWAYAPGTGAHWQAAWKKTGTCSTTVASLPKQNIVANSKDKIKVFSNPVVDDLIIVNLSNLSLRGNVQSQSTIQIFDINGVIVLSKKINLGNKKNTFDVRSLKDGIYFYGFEKNGKKHTGRFIKVK